MSNLSYMQYVSNNCREIYMSTECACIYCFRKFGPYEIIDWVETDNTAICPYCGTDAVVPNSAIAYTLDNLREWHSEGFGNENNMTEDQQALLEALNERYKLIDEINLHIKHNSDLIEPELDPDNEVDLEKLSFDELIILRDNLNAHIKSVKK